MQSKFWMDYITRTGNILEGKEKHVSHLLDVGLAKINLLEPDKLIVCLILFLV